MKNEYTSLRRTAATPRRGFALLITIVLVAFLVLLLVGLATFTRVETQVADNSQQLAKARQNALMALNIAVGQLQKTTGPDQRATASADIAAAATGERLPSGSPARNTDSVTGKANGLVAVAGASVQDGTRHWTGVWGRAGTAYSTAGGSPSFAKSVYEETPSPILLNWLVSGNEDRSFTIDATGLVQSSTADGTAAAGLAPFTPGARVIWSAADLDTTKPDEWDTSAYADLEIKTPGTRAVLLVGPKSAGTAPDADGNPAIGRYVVAPLQDIMTPAAQVPGMGSGSDVAIGRYAWWVGDEGVKAGYKLSDPFPGKNSPDGSTTAAAEARLRLMSSPRSGIEMLPGFAAYPKADDTAAAQLTRIVQMSQAAFLDSNLATTAGREQLASNFHDLTPWSKGLLTDTLSGGLRQDLTFYFEQPSLSADLAGKGIIPATWSPSWGVNDLAPKWDWLYSFYNTNPDIADPKLTVRPETPTQVGVSPIITQFRMLAFTDGALASNVNPIKPAGTAFQLPVRCNVAFVLANPYNVTLEIPANAYEFVLQNTYNRTGVTTSNPPVPTAPNETPGGLVIGVSPASHGYDESLGSHVLLRAENDTVSKSTLDTVRFTVPALSIAPGQTVTLSVDGSSTVAGGILPPAAGSEDPVPLVADDISTGHYFTSKTTLDFTTLGLPPPAPANAQPNTVALTYVHFQVFVTVTLRAAGNGPILQQWRDFSFSKKDETTGTGDNVFGNFHVKFMPPARRNMDSSGAANVFHYALFSEARPFADLNLRAKTLDHTALDDPGRLWTGPSYAGGINRNGQQSLKGGFTENLSPAPWAEDFDTGMRSSAASKGVFFDFPRRESSTQPPVLSLGHLQHASLSADDWHANTSINYQPAYAVGNSYSNPFVTRSQAMQNRTRSYYKAPAGQVRYFDLSYLLNTALWDAYYFSGIPQAGSDFAPRNARYELIPDTTAAQARASSAASHLFVNGVFNINSTSKAAWVALLAGLNERRVNADSASSGVPFPRTLWQPENNAAKSGTGDAAYAGYRRLTAAQIDLLATEIVKRVRARGPFVSLSHFINRSLVAATAKYNPDINDAEQNTTDLAQPSPVPMGRGLSGPLQAAIDSTATGINLFPNIGPRLVAGKLEDRTGGDGDRLLFAGEMLATSGPNAQKPDTSNTNPVYFADKLVDLPNLDPFIDSTGAAPGPQGRTSTGIPDWLMQGDVLQAIGPALSARSDTFTIRTYGEVVNPAVPDERGARVWCEAVVQRMPDYVNSGADAADIAPAALTNADNRRFGRRYVVVSFRWLNPEDI